MKNLRDIINANTKHPSHVQFLTLTYQENMTDVKILYQDFSKFMKRLRYYLNKRDFISSEYIVAIEPQARGAWHCHVLLIFPKKAPFIPNDELHKIWNHGFTYIRSLKGNDNIGVYLTAYLTDMKLSEVNDDISKIKPSQLKQIEEQDEEGKKVNKAVIKGARLHLYPVGVRIYRTSKGIKRPIVSECTEDEALRRIGPNAELKHEATIQIEEEKKVINIVNTRHYVVKPRKKKG
jgi:hypothetical protein